MKIILTIILLCLSASCLGVEPKEKIKLTKEEYKELEAFKKASLSLRLKTKIEDLTKLLGKPTKIVKPYEDTDLEKSADKVAVYFVPMSVTTSLRVYFKQDIIIGFKILDSAGTTAIKPKYYDLKVYWSKYDNFDIYTIE